MTITDKIKKIGLGSVQFGKHYGISNRNGQTSLSEVEQILNFAQQAGIRYIDTASGYGEAERILGKFDLNNFKIISKFLTSDNSPMNISTQFFNSLKNLSVEKLYGYMFHRANHLIQQPRYWDIFIELKTNGKVEKIGYSLNETAELEELLKLGFYPDIIQVPYNLFDNRFESYLPALKSNGCEIHARSAFLQGLFFAETKALPTFFDALKDTINELQLAYKDELPAVLLDYVISKNFIDVVIIGVENQHQLSANINNLHKSYQLEWTKHNITHEILKPFMWPKNK